MNIVGSEWGESGESGKIVGSEWGESGKIVGVCGK